MNNIGWKSYFNEKLRNLTRINQRSKIQSSDMRRGIIRVGHNRHRILDLSLDFFYTYFDKDRR